MYRFLQSSRGGLDSTLVTAEMARQSGARKVSAFTIGFSHSEYDETEPADQDWRAIGVTHECSASLDERASPTILRTVSDRITPFQPERGREVPSFALCA
jgi:asparagine synthetase B (glutamine-hydrolysing)